MARLETWLHEWGIVARWASRVIALVTASLAVTKSFKPNDPFWAWATSMHWWVYLLVIAVFGVFSFVPNMLEARRRKREGDRSAQPPEPPVSAPFIRAKSLRSATFRNNTMLGISQLLDVDGPVGEVKAKGNFVSAEIDPIIAARMAADQLTNFLSNDHRCGYGMEDQAMPRYSAYIYPTVEIATNALKHAGKLTPEVEAALNPTTPDDLRRLAEALNHLADNPPG